MQGEACHKTGFTQTDNNRSERDIFTREMSTVY